MSKDTFEYPVSLRWSDLDPNYHLRHSVYYDLAAQARTVFLVQNGLSLKDMASMNFGPILFKEECSFLKELHLGDRIVIRAQVSKLKEDLSRFSIKHEFMRGEELCAILIVHGAFTDTKLRKLTVPPPKAAESMKGMPKSDDFEWS